MADTVMTVRLVLKEMARQEGMRASFMPKPLAGVQGSGMHTHLSLWEGERNAFFDEDDRYGLSQVAYRFVAGLLRHAREITAVTNQWVNSYKRLVARLRGAGRTSPGPATTAPRWSASPWSSAASSESTRIEYREPDSACNPYLAFAVILAAGLRGVEEGYELPPEADTNLFNLSDRELAPRASQPLPGSLKDAVDEMERSELLARHAGRARLRMVHPQQAGGVGRNTRPTSASSSSTATWLSCERPRGRRPGPPQRGFQVPMEPLLCYPDPVPAELALVLHRAGYPFQGANSGDSPTRR